MALLAQAFARGTHCLVEEVTYAYQHKLGLVRGVDPQRIRYNVRNSSTFSFGALVTRK